MQSRIENERRTNLIITYRPDSSQLVDLHVYIIPRKIWRNEQNLAENIAMQQAISVGFVRVPEDLTIYDLRRYIIDICGNNNDNFPKNWLYLRSVGRCLTKVKQQQENELKVKNFRPPTTFSSEIYLLEEDHDDQSIISVRKQDDLFQESTIIRQPSWIIKSMDESSSNSFVNHIPSIKLSPRDLLKFRQEQERLYRRQIELAQKRQEIENQYHKEQKAATKIQRTFRNYRHRQNIKQQQEDIIEIEKLQQQERQLTRQQVEVEHAEEKQAHDVVRISNRLEDLRIKRIELEANRLLIVRQIQRLQTQIAIRRREEKVLWKKKYLIEKKQTTKSIGEEQNRSKYSTDVDNQLEQAKIRLNNSTKLRQQAEYESRLLRQELHQISSNLNALDRYRLPKQQQRQQIETIPLDMTLQY